MRWIKTLAFFLAVTLLLCGMTACRDKSASDSQAVVVTGGDEEPEEVHVRGTIPATKPALVVNGTTATAGEKQVEVIIDVTNNPGILGMDFDLYFDDTVMTLTDAQSLLTQEGCEFTPAAYYKNPTSFLWDFQDINWTEDGAILKLYFDIAQDAPAGNYEIKIMYSYGNIFDANFEPIDFGVKNGNISIS